MLCGCSTVAVTWPHAFAVSSQPIPCSAVHWVIVSLGDRTQRTLSYLKTWHGRRLQHQVSFVHTSTVSEGNCSCLAVFVRCLASMSQTFQIHTPGVQQYSSICCQHSIIASPNVWQPGTISGVVDRYFGVTARYVIFIPPILHTDSAKLELSNAVLASVIVW